MNPLGWLRAQRSTPGGPVRYETAPVEPAGGEVAGLLDHLFPQVPAEVTRQFTVLDKATAQKVDSLDRAALRAAAKGDWRQVDALLDARNSLRPARPAPVPVVPGRSS